MKPKTKSGPVLSRARATQSFVLHDGREQSRTIYEGSLVDLSELVDERGAALVRLGPEYFEAAEIQTPVDDATAPHPEPTTKENPS